MTRSNDSPMQSISSALLTLRDVGLVYRARPALRQIDWTLHPGEQWACLGPNGAGKTSLARVISGDARHASGTVERAARLDQQGVAYVCFEQALYFAKKRGIPVALCSLESATTPWPARDSRRNT